MDGKESLLYFGGQQHGGDGAVERVDSYPKADLDADNPDGGASCRNIAC